MFTQIAKVKFQESSLFHHHHQFISSSSSCTQSDGFISLTPCCCLINSICLLFFSPPSVCQCFNVRKHCLCLSNTYLFFSISKWKCILLFGFICIYFLFLIVKVPIMKKTHAPSVSLTRPSSPSEITSTYWCQPKCPRELNKKLSERGDRGVCLIGQVMDSRLKIYMSVLCKTCIGTGIGSINSQKIKS